ncbi:MAG TPA: hypothetical protein VK927_06970, partial [Adhaeribacter sp.]|nr:hypothetical protein [Adhaeribacter sp.]
CPPPEVIPASPDPNITSGLTTVVPGPQYAAGPTRTFFFGKLYRSTWTTPVKVPYLDLRNTLGGLTPEGKGGGRQTRSLKFSAPDSSQYVFRSVDKDPIKALPLVLRETFATDVIREITATGHPYGALIVSSLLDSTDILHARPRLYVLPNHPDLGPYRAEFAGLFGMLEDRPVSPKKDRKAFAEADEIPRTVRLYRKLYDDHNNRIDAYAFGKARAFDIWIGDFGRHDDNWRWAGFEKDGKTIFKPIPRDRDHAFSQWNGFFPWLADLPFVVKTVQNFGYDYQGLKSLNAPARYLDQALLSPLNRQDFQRIAAELQQEMTDETIDKAILAAPAEVAPVSGYEIGAKLKARIKKLPKALDAYYLNLAKVVDILGSNKDEYFLIERLEGGQVRVQQFVKDPASNGPSGEALYDRTFSPSETKEIRVFALDGQDVIEISGSSPKSILVRVIGGEGRDQIRDNSSVPGLKHHTRIYDTSDTAIEPGAEAKDLTSDKADINAYDRKEYRENYKSIAPGLLYNRSDGLGASLNLSATRFVFREPEPKRTYSMGIAGTAQGAFILNGGALWNNVLGKWGLGTAVTYGSYFPFYNFFGLGNNTVKDDELFRPRKYYVARYKGVRAEAFTQTNFLQKSYFRIGPVFESLNSTTQSGTILDENITAGIVLGKEKLLGAQLELDFDLRDQETFTRRGLRFYLNHTTSKRLNGQKNTFGLTQGFAQYFGTARLGIPVTLTLKAGGAKNFGKNLPFYKYTSLGLRDNLRGYVNNRFFGDGSAYLNSELRFHLGRNKNQFLPFYYGLIGFYDQGQVWYQGIAEGGWHRGYGAGFYIAPLEERYALTLLLGHSREETLLLQFSLGLVLDK